MAETFARMVKPLPTARARLRKRLRDGYLGLRTLIPPPRRDRFLRSFCVHYVFDDQRASFERLIRALKRVGSFVATDDAVAMIRGEVPVDGRYFHLSFDDGLGCLLSNAAPVLDEAGVPAIVFVNSALAAGPDEATRTAWYQATNWVEGTRILDWEGLRALRAAGFEIGAHTRNHLRLSAISGDAALMEAEIAGCRREIEQSLGGTCRYFAWPYGRLADIDARSLAAVRSAGYAAAFGAYRGPIVPGRTNPFMIPRHNFEPDWPERTVLWFARGGLETPAALPD